MPQGLRRKPGGDHGIHVRFKIPFGKQGGRMSEDGSGQFFQGLLLFCKRRRQSDAKEHTDADEGSEEATKTKADVEGERKEMKAVGPGREGCAFLHERHHVVNFCR